MIICHDQVRFIPSSQGWFNISKISGKHHINKRKDKNHMIISEDAGKAFHNSTSIHDKNLSDWVGETYFNIIKPIYDKPIANITLNSEKLKAFPLRPETRQGYPFSPLLLNIILEVRAAAIRQ